MASSARIEELRKKFEENPRRYFAPLANEYRKAGDIDQAIAICREYLPQQPGHMSGHIVYGQALYEAKQAEEAKAVFETALALDPENLIALRHLGDIALLVGDSESARMWYGRVLEADPRNEEIQAQLASLDKSVAPTPVVAPAVERTAPTPAAPTLEVPVTKAPAAQPVTATSPTVVVSAVKPPAPPPTTATSPTAEITRDSLPAAPAPAPAEPAPANDLGLEPTQRRFSVPISTAKLELDAPVSAPREAPPMESFSLEGLETTSMGASPTEAPPPVPSLSSVPTVELDFGTPPAPAPEPANLDVGTPTAAPPEPPAAPTVDLDFGTPSPTTPAPAAQTALAGDLDFGAPASPSPAQPTPPAAAASEDLPLLDIGELPSAPPAAAATPSTSEAEAAPPHAFAMDLPVPEPVQAEPAALAPDWSPPLAEPERIEAPAAAPDSGPFVTETMAELYLTQGHREEALKVYRALLEQRPEDSSLREKVNALSPQLAASEPQADSGPTIRELLLAIASRRPGVRSALPNGNGGSPAAPARAAMEDALAALLGAGDAIIAPTDENAAIALGHAFMDLNGMERGDGGAQASEPSIDSVLKAAPPPNQATPSNFSFDQFFSQRATSDHPIPSSPPQRPEESGDDVAQFNQWLQGLKQR